MNKPEERREAARVYGFILMIFSWVYTDQQQVAIQEWLMM